MSRFQMEVGSPFVLWRWGNEEPDHNGEEQRRNFEDEAERQRRKSEDEAERQRRKSEDEAEHKKRRFVDEDATDSDGSSTVSIPRVHRIRR